MKPFVAMPMECATRRSGGISVDDCAKTEILVCGFGADSESSAPLCAQASDPQTPILVRSQSAIKMPAEVADFPLILSKVPSYAYAAKIHVSLLVWGERVVVGSLLALLPISTLSLKTVRVRV